MSRLSLPNASFLLIALSACAVAGNVAFKFSEEQYMSGQDGIYDQAIVSGFDEIRNGRYERAIENFENALATPRHEEPNYEALIPIAFAHCSLGHSFEARAAASEAACALSIELGQLKCPEDAEDETFLRATGTSSCYKKMCGDALTPYYESPTPAQEDRVNALWDDLRRVKAKCSIE